MQSFSVSNMVSQVRLALDRNKSDSQLTSLGNIDTLDLDAIIKSKFYDALWILFTQAPIELLGIGEDFSKDDDNPTKSRTIVWESPSTDVQSGYMALPDDFLRLITFKMSDWSIPVTEAINETSPLYLVQQSKFGGVRGNPEKPVVAIVTTGETAGASSIERHLEFYCSRGGTTTIERARYLPMPNYTNSSTNVYMPERLSRAFVYQVAELTAITLGDTTTAQNLDAVLKQLLVVRQTIS